MYKDLKFFPSDFGYDDEEKITRVEAANLAKQSLQNQLTDCCRVHGFIFGDGDPSYRWYRKSWAGAHGKSTHHAYLVGVKKYRDAT